MLLNGQQCVGRDKLFKTYATGENYCRKNTQILALPVCVKHSLRRTLLCLQQVQGYFEKRIKMNSSLSLNARKSVFNS